MIAVEGMDCSVVRNWRDRVLEVNEEVSLSNGWWEVG